MNTTCPKCGKPARRDTDTMDTFVDSSWYMYRYVDPKIDTAFMNKEIGRKWLPVKQYTGGVEHAILHLLYMRFVTKALRDLGELWFDEPVLRFRYQGTIVFKGRKMSKSRGNVQTPDEYVKRYGADTLRLFMMFMGPWVDGADWDASGIEGVHRFLRRVWELALTDAEPSGPRDADVDGAVQRTIKKVTEDLGDRALQHRRRRDDGAGQHAAARERPESQRGRRDAGHPAGAVRAAHHRGAVAAPRRHRLGPPAALARRTTRPSPRRARSRSSFR